MRPRHTIESADDLAWRVFTNSASTRERASQATRGTLSRCCAW
jgi:hypothetical protein